MYCGAELPVADADADADAGSEESAGDAAAGPSLREALDPALLASLPPRLRAQLTAELGPASPPAPGAAGPTAGDPGPSATGAFDPGPSEPSTAPPPAAPPPTTGGSPAPTPSSPDSPTLTHTPALEDPTDLIDRPSLDQWMAEEGLAGDEDETQRVEVADAGAPDGAMPDDEDAIRTDRFETVGYPSHASPLLRGRGPWGPRESVARVLLLPDPGYRQQQPWLRARLHNRLGIDAYTANLYLQREFPVFLGAFDDEDEARELADHLAGGGLRMLVLTRSMVESYRDPYPAESAEIDESSILFETPGRPPLQIQRDELEQAILGEVKPLERESGPLVERTFWKIKPRTARSFDEIQHPYWVLEVVAAPPSPAVRLRSDRFDFGCLAEDRASSTLLNLRNVPACLAPPGGPLPLDDLFRRVPRVRREAPPAEGDEGREPSAPEEEVLFSEYAMIQTHAWRAYREQALAAAAPAAGTPDPD